VACGLSGADEQMFSHLNVCCHCHSLLLSPIHPTQQQHNLPPLLLGILPLHNHNYYPHCPYKANAHHTSKFSSSCDGARPSLPSAAAMAVSYWGFS